MPLATVGTVMPSGMEIGRRKILGELVQRDALLAASSSSSATSTRASASSTGAEPGTPITDALGIETDVLWDLEVNPNRPDAMSVAGRPRPGRQALDCRSPCPSPSVAAGARRRRRPVEILDPDLCGGFTAVIRGSPSASPDGSPAADPARHAADQRRGRRSNYVMLELGQPNHPYDLATLPGGGLRCRRARAGETCDPRRRRAPLHRRRPPDLRRRGQRRSASPGSWAAPTEISDATTDVLLEMA